MKRDRLSTKETKQFLKKVRGKRLQASWWEDQSDSWFVPDGEFLDDGLFPRMGGKLSYREDSHGAEIVGGLDRTADLYWIVMDDNWRPFDD